MGVLTTLETECKDCYKCVRACPVKAIKVNTGHAQIWEEQCILDGRCISVCPRQAKQVRDDLPAVQAMLAEGETVAVSIAPSYVCAFDVPDPGCLVTALRRLGFAYVSETAVGADAVAAAHIQYLREDPNAKLEPRITSSCPTVVNLIEKHYPEAIRFLVPVVSPMVAHARLLHSRCGPQVKVVFIGPCVAKKAEAEEAQFAGDIAAVLTFAELERWLEQENINAADLPPEPCDTLGSRWAKLFPLAGGLLRTAGLSSDLLAERMATVTGIDECKSLISHLCSGNDLALDLIEMLACEGGCIDGPCMVDSAETIARRQRMVKYVKGASGSTSQGTGHDTGPVRDVQETGAAAALEAAESSEAAGGAFPGWLLRTYADRKIRLPEPSEEELQQILAAIGKREPADELNCGACGYDSCRDKARAVYQGVAESEMCMPYMRAKAESLADVIITSTPNGIMVVDDQLSILALNPAAESMFRCRASDFLHQPLAQLIPTDSFNRALQHRQLIKESREYPEHGLIVRQYIFTPEDQDVVIGIFTDITAEKQRQDELDRLKATTLERAQDVINRQMRVAQEIAGLLGETTAETKVLLSQLMRLIQDGDNP